MPAQTQEPDVKIIPDDFLTGDPNDFISKEQEGDKKEGQKQEPVKPTPTKELKAQYEKTKKELEETRKKIEEYENRLNEINELAPLKPVAEYLKTKAGKVDEEAVKEYIIEKNRKRKQALGEFETKLKEKDFVIKELEIEKSQEWQEEYIAPINKARDNLVASIVNFDNEGKPRHLELHQKLFNELIRVDDKGKPKSAIEMKAAIKQFAQEYEKVTGEEYEVPILKEVVIGVESFHKSILAANKAKAAWSEEMEKRQKEKTFDEAKKEEAMIRKEIEGRNYVANKFIESIDKEIFESIEENFSDKFIEAAKTEHKYFSDLLQKKEDIKPRKYDELIDLAAKGRLFDELTKKLKSQAEEIAELKKKTKSSAPFNGGATRTPIHQHQQQRTSERPDDFLD